LPICVLIIVLAPSLVQNILGSRWDGTLPLIQILAMMSFIGLFGETIVPILKGLGQPHKVAVLETVQSLFLIVFVLALVGRYGLVGAALAWLPAIAVSQGISFVFAKQILYKPFKGLQIPMIAIMFASGLGAGVAFGVDSTLGGIFGFVIANLIALAVIGIVLLALDRRFDLGLAYAFTRTFPQIATLVGFSPAKS
jgi:O-antigen/teichoic acid export membrane protein